MLRMSAQQTDQEVTMSNKIRKGDRVLFEGRSIVVTSVTSLTVGGPMASFEQDGETLSLIHI